MILPKTFVTKICWAQKIFGPQFFWTNSFPIPQLFFNLNLLDQNLWNLTFFDPHFLDPALLGLKFVRHGLLLDQKVFGPNFFLTENCFGSSTFRPKVFWTWIVLGSKSFLTQFVLQKQQER